MLPTSTAPTAAEAADEVSDLDYLLKILHWSGTMRHPHAGPWASRVHYLVKALSTVALSLFICSQSVLLSRDGVADLQRFTLTLSVLATASTWMMRLRHIAAWEPEFHKLAVQVRRDFGEFLSADDLQLLRLRNTSIRRFVSAYLCSGVVTSAIYASTPISADGLPFVLALPYDVSRPLSFAATWLYTLYINYFVVVGTMAADSFNVVLIVQLRNQLNLLSRNLHSLNDNISHSNSSSFQTQSIKNTQQYENRIIHCRLRKSVLHHQSVIRNVQLLEKCLSGMLLGQSLSIGTSLCLQLFQAATRAEGFQDLGKTSSYMLAMLLELFMYCWFGDDLVSESEKVALSAYDAVTSVQECPTSTKRSLLLLMVRAQRPLRVTAGGFFTLSRESFVSVLNVSYSFFAILRNFKDD
ncbi:odorant receptor Or2-like [Schistocerca gregaria]|uniref:odorant receptor Or2-like n=1 Tax=Schistocerca gregaria TaxID=7010 RepID=UPI00211E9B4C|nr:odorant receptor Or2-like [Schistocerca gregaria]